MSASITPNTWKRASGYSHAIKAQGTYLAISGQVGWDESETLVGDGFLAQAQRALENIVAIVRAAGGRPEHVARLTWYVVDADDYRSCAKDLGTIYRQIFGPHYPAMSLLVVAALLEPGARVEIEATAILEP